MNVFMLQKLRQANVSLGLYADFIFWSIYGVYKKTPNLGSFNLNFYIENYQRKIDRNHTPSVM